MPARQDQTLQIFLMIFIFLFLVTGVFAYIGWRGYSEADTRATTLDASVKDKTQKMGEKDAEIEDLRKSIGFGSEPAAEVKKATEEDLKNFGGPVADEASRTYRKVVEALFIEGQATLAREAKSKDEIKALKDKLASKENESKKQIDQYDAQTKKALADLAQEQRSFAEQRKAMEASQSSLQKSLSDQQTKYEAQVTDKDAKLKALEAQLAKLDRANRDLKDQRKDEPGSFEVADGHISLVTQSGTVWINLGTADSLRRQVTFSVFDADLHDAEKATKKGSIEVTQLLGDHIAEAKVTSDDPKNPIIPGDNIYSQVWHRGKQLHFALTGIIDFDGDGQSDMELARQLIDMNGGIVDAYLKDDGKMAGEITANTRFLVLGDIPNSTAKGALVTGYHDMSKEAASMGVQTISLPQFLDRMGYKPQERMVHLGVGAKASDFPPRSDTGTTPADTRPSSLPRLAKPPKDPATTVKP